MAAVDADAATDLRPDAPANSADGGPAGGRTDDAPVAGPSATGGRPVRRRANPVVVAVHVVVLAIVSLLLFAPGIDTLPVTDRDEARFVEASRQMVTSGDWLDIRFRDDARYKKPVGVYWLQAAAIVLHGGGADAPLWVNRIPSVVGMTLAVLFTYGAGVALFGPGGAFFGALLVATTLLAGVEARFAKTDGVLLATVTAAQFALALVWSDPARARRFGRNALFWVAVGAGVLVKGPIIVLVVGLTLLTLLVTDRSLSVLKALAPLPGIAAALLIALPWYVAIGIHSDGAFYRDSLSHDFFAKILSAQEGHGAPPGTFALASFVTFWPASAFIPLGIAWLIAARRQPAARFLVAWALPAWIAFELVPTKLPHYVLPLLPALTLSVGGALAAGALTAKAFWRRAFLAWIAVGGLAVAVGLNAAFVALQERADPIGLAGAVGAGALAIAAWWMARRERPRIALGLVTLTAGAIAVLGWVHLLPAASSLWLSDRLAEAVARAPACENRTVVGYREPSVVVRLGPQTRLDGAEAGAAAFAAGPCGTALVTEAEAPAFEAALAAAGTAGSVTERVTARNIDGLTERTVRVYVRPVPEAPAPAATDAPATSGDGGEGAPAPGNAPAEAPAEAPAAEPAPAAPPAAEAPPAPAAPSP